MAESLDRLIHRYLEGLLSEEEGRLLNERIKADPRARRRLAEMAFDTAQFPDMMEVEEAVRSEAPPAPARRAWWAGPRSSLAAAAVILAAVGVALIFWPSAEKPVQAPAPPSAGGRKKIEPRPAADPSVRKSPAEKEKRPPRPKNADLPPKEDPKAARFQGFRGTVRGAVEGKGDNRIALRVLAVGLPGQEKPHELVGQRIDVGPGGGRNEDDEQAPDNVHLAFIKKIQKGQEIRLDVRHERGGSFVISTLTEEQVDWAGRPAEREERKPEKKREGREGDRGGEDR